MDRKVLLAVVEARRGRNMKLSRPMFAGCAASMTSSFVGVSPAAGVHLVLEEGTVSRGPRSGAHALVFR